MSKELIAKQWKSHRDIFTLKEFQMEEGWGFLVIDHYVNPPHAWVMGFFDGQPQAYEYDFPHVLDLSAREIVSIMLENGKRLPLADAIRLLGDENDTPPLTKRAIQRFALSFDNPRIAGRLPYDDLHAAETKRQSAYMEKVRGAFNKETLACLSALDSFQWRDYSFYDDKTEKGKMRRQAAEVYPLLAGLFNQFSTLRMAIDNGSPLIDSIQELFGVNADGKPKITKALLSRLRGVKWPTNGIPAMKFILALSELPPDWIPREKEEWDAFCAIHSTIGTTLREMTGLGVDVLYNGCQGKWVEFRERIARAYTDNRPVQGADEEAMEYFRHAIDWKALEKLPRHKVLAAAEEIPQTLTLPGMITREDITDWIKRLYAPDTSTDALQTACMCAEDMIDAMVKKVILPLAANESGYSDVPLSNVVKEQARIAACKILFSGKAANSIMEMSRHLHSQYEHIMQAGVEETNKEDDELAGQRNYNQTLNSLGISTDHIDPDGWPPLSSIFQAPNGLYIVPLTNPRELIEEGWPGYCVNGSRENPDGSLGLRHCVGGYSNACRNSGHHILSIRRLTGTGRPSFERLSTIELESVSYGSTDFKVRQHYGMENGNPPEESHRAWEWYQAEVKKGTIPLNYEKIREHIGSVRSSIDDVQRECNYNWKNRDRIVDAMYPWGQYVGKKYRKMQIDEFAQQPEIQEVVEIIRPTRRPQP